MPTIFPDSDVATSGWFGPGSHLYSSIDDQTDTARIQGNPTSAVAKFGLETPSQTPSTAIGGVLTFRALRGSSHAASLTVELREAGVLRATKTGALTTAYAEYTVTIAEEISDYSALEVWLDVTGGSGTNPFVNVDWIKVDLPAPGFTVTGEIATVTLSVVTGEVLVGFLIADQIATVTVSIFEGTVAITAQQSTWRDVFVHYNPSTDQFHVGQIDMTHMPDRQRTEAASSVEFNHLVLTVATRELYRMRYLNTFASAFIEKASLTTAEIGGDTYSRPNTVIMGFWSRGSYPSLDTENPTLLYELSTPNNLTEQIETDQYPNYGSTSADEDNWVLLPATDFGDPFTVKRLSRVWIWTVPPPDPDASVTLRVTVWPTPVDSQGLMGKSVTRTLTVAGYDATETSPSQPVRLVYADFDPQGDPENDDESVSGIGFEVKIEMETGIGIWRVALEYESGGQHELLDSQE